MLTTEDEVSNQPRLTSIPGYLVQGSDFGFGVLISDVFLLWACESKYIRANFPHLNLLCPFSDAVPTEVTIYMLKRVVSRIPIAPVYLIGQSCLIRELSENANIPEWPGRQPDNTVGSPRSYTWQLDHSVGAQSLPMAVFPTTDIQPQHDPSPSSS